MSFSLLLALVVLMATGSGCGREHGKTRYSKRLRGEEPSSESDSRTDFEQDSVKGKGKEPLTAMKKKGADSPPGSRSGAPVIGGHVKSSASDSTPSAPPRQVQHHGSSESERVLTLQSIHRDLRTLKERLKIGFKRIEEGIKRLDEELQHKHDFSGGKHDDVVPGASAPITSHVPTSHTYDGDDDVTPDEP